MERFIVSLYQAVLDCLEECVATMTIVKGKRLYSVFLVLTGLFGCSLLFRVLSVPCFISWQESLFAWVAIGIICCINYVNKKSINRIKAALTNRKGEHHNGRRK